MKLNQLVISESKGGSLGFVAMSKYIGRKLGVHLLKIPGVEHFHNSAENGYGVRFVLLGSTKCIRFNWNSLAAVGRPSDLHSIDLFMGKTHDPNFTIHTKGISMVQALPMVVDKMVDPEISRDFAFPVAAAEALSEAIMLEAHRNDFTAEGAIVDFLHQLESGKTFTRSEFIARYHIVHSGIFDTIFDNFKDRFLINNKRISLGSNANLDSLKDSILSKAGVVEVTRGGTKEVYFKSKQEEELEKMSDRTPYVDTLEHLEGLTSALIKGSFNALFVAGKGGSLSGCSTINVIVNSDKETTSTDSKTVSMLWLEEYVRSVYDLQELEIGKLYKVSNVMIETPNGFKDTVGFIKKQGKKAVVEFDSGIVHMCLHNHMYIPVDAPVVYTYDLAPGDKILTRDGSVDIVKSVELTEEDMFAYDLSVDSLDSIYVTADGIQHHNTGKTQTVERVLQSHGLSDGDGYFKNTGSASAAGVYTLLYHHRNDIILFDDSDGALADQDARNLIKAATDTKKSRKMVWNKKSSFIFDPDNEDAESYEEDLGMAPKYFDFKGRIIFISNLPLAKLDPDGALRTRAFVIQVDPTDTEMFEYMDKILNDVRLEDGLTLSPEERTHVLEIVKTSKRGDVSLRKLVRALNLAASGAPNWEKLVELYS